MSADVVAFPERTFRPEPEKVLDILASVDDVSSPGEMFGLAVAALRGVEALRGMEPMPSRAQGVVNGVTVAFIALGQMLGFGEDAIALALADAIPP